MKPLIFDFPYPSPLGKNVRTLLKSEEGKVFIQYFPDDETYLRIESHVEGREVIVNASLFHPNTWILNLFFLADALRAQGAKRVGLLTPYLAYMRQDKVFHPGEALTSVTFAKLLSSSFDYLVTIDPHLHRYHSLEEIYSIPAIALKAAPLISQWIHANVKKPFIIGPDSESAQWVEVIAKDSPYIVLDKVRHKDGHVKITWPEIKGMEKKTPVLVDDIISSGGTMLQAIQHLKEQGFPPPICIAIHPIFAENSYEKLWEAGIEDVVTCNSIPHPSNQIDLAPILAPCLKKVLASPLKLAFDIPSDFF